MSKASFYPSSELTGSEWARSHRVWTLGTMKHVYLSRDLWGRLKGGFILGIEDK